MTEIKKITLMDMEIVYLFDEKGTVSFALIPCRADAEERHIPDTFFEKAGADPMVQFSCTGDATSIGFAAGETRHDSALTMSMQYVSQVVKTAGDETVVETTLRSPEGYEAVHTVAGNKNSRGLKIFTRIRNDSADDVMIEALSSSNISCITPFCEDAGRDRLFLHRFRSRWSEEGRHEVRSIEDLLLEPSWAEFAVRCEKFGTTGSMPVRGYFPFAAIEDREAGVIWAVSLACSSSWQFEAVRIDKGLSLSCGIADYEAGHWRKKLAPGEEFVTPEAYVTVTAGSFSDACDRLLDVQREGLLPKQRKESLPAVFNEYCTTWGEPSEDSIAKILKVVSGDRFDYFVIDAGWYADSVKGWQDNMGDWEVAPDLFPNGIKKASDMIKAAGMKPGIWFELEVVGKDSDRVTDTAHLLTRDGKVIISGTRRFWDMRSEWVQDYLGKKVIDFLNENGFEYIKIDYNDTIGIGCDGAESVGEGLRECVEATKDFFRRIREQVPGIAIEICSSGGHRLEPSFMELADYLSFSDAHEEKEIPVIAADLQRLVLARKSQIWAVLRSDDDMRRIAYSVCAGMYGVLCISGDVASLSKEKWEFALEGVEFYGKVSPVIAEGFTERFGPFQHSNRDLRDYQASVRYGKDGRALVIVHSFRHAHLQRIRIPLRGEYKIVEIYETGDHRVNISGGKNEGAGIAMEFDSSFDALAILLAPL